MSRAASLTPCLSDDERRLEVVPLDPDSATIADQMSGILYCGDNLEVLSELNLVPAESVDLIYLDPPFNSQRTFNIVYKGSTAQTEAFKDYWSWAEAAPQYARVIDAPETPAKLRTLLRGLHDLLIDDDADLLAYITMMAPRIFALHRVLKTTGSLYLHCDPTASHYLKLVLDSVFGLQHFRNEIIWKRTNAHNDPKRFGGIHDVLLFYRKSDNAFFHPIFLPLAAAHVSERFSKVDEHGRRYKLENPCGPGPRGGDSGLPWMDFDPTPRGRAWAPPRKVCEKLGIDNSLPTRKKLDLLMAAGRIEPPKKRGSIPMLRVYLDDEDTAAGTTLQDIWAYQSYTTGFYVGDAKSCIDQDVAWLGPTNAERTPYPTQKPVGLITRILRSSCPEGGVVLDPFCGCGTTIEACEQLGLRWIGIDIAAKAVEITEGRFEKKGWQPPEVSWYPPDRDAAVALAGRPKGGKNFETWILRKIRAVRRRAHDRGIDGEAFFKDGQGRVTHVLISVKSGKLKPEFVRDLRGTLERERLPIGVLVTLQEPSKEMKLEATHAGYLRGPDGNQIPRLQFLTVDQIFAGSGVLAPGMNVTEMPKPTVPEGAPQNQEQLSLRLEPPKPLARSSQQTERASAAQSARKSDAPEAIKISKKTAKKQ